MSVKSFMQDAAARVYQRIYDRARAKELACPGHKPGILFASCSRSEAGGNIERVRRRVIERGLGETYELREWFHESIGAAKGFGTQLDFIRKLAASDVVFVDDYLPFLYFIDFPADVKVVQLWHAVGSFKTIGFSRSGHDSERRRQTSRAHRSYTHVIVSAECDRPHYADAFNLPVERVYSTGVPRIDDFLDAEWQAEAREGFFQRFSQARGKKVVLFAPTFRGDDVRAGGYDFSRVDFGALAQLCREHGAFLCVKLHPLTRGFEGIPAGFDDAIADASGTREVNDILPAADVVITDYSSVVYEASLLKLPMLFYAYDLHEYEAGRGFYEPYESFVPGPVLRSFDDLREQLANVLEDDAARSGLSQRAAAFAGEHFAHIDRNAADRVIGLVL